MQWQSLHGYLSQILAEKGLTSWPKPRRKVFNPNHGIAQKPQWAHSLAWLEHPADNREVTGSNPVGPILHFTEPRPANTLGEER